MWKEVDHFQNPVTTAGSFCWASCLENFQNSRENPKNFSVHGSRLLIDHGTVQIWVILLLDGLYLFSFSQPRTMSVYAHISHSKAARFAHARHILSIKLALSLFFCIFSGSALIEWFYTPSLICLWTFSFDIVIWVHLGLIPYLPLFPASSQELLQMDNPFGHLSG